MISWKASRVGTDHPPLFPHAFLHAMATVVSAYFSTSAAWCISRMRLRWLNRFRLQGARLGTRVEGDHAECGAQNPSEVVHRRTHVQEIAGVVTPRYGLAQAERAMGAVAVTPTAHRHAAADAAEPIFPAPAFRTAVPGPDAYW